MPDIASLSAPDWHWYSRSAVRFVTVWVSSWAVASRLAGSRRRIHLGPVPVRVAGRDPGLLAEVDRGDQLGAGVVVGVAAERVGVVPEDLAEVVVDRVALGLAGGS